MDLFHIFLRFQANDRDLLEKEKLPDTDIMASKKKIDILLCDMCLYNGKNKDAVYECDECEEHFCENCKFFHNAENNCHSIRSICLDKVYCFLCKLKGQEVVATLICTECTNPKLLCSTCARYHSALKKTRGHTFSLDFKERMTEEIYNRKENDLKPKQESEPNKKTKTIEKPYGTDCKSNCISLTWKTDYSLTENEKFQVIIKEASAGMWNQYSAEQECRNPYITVNGLKPDTSYVLKVRVVNQKSAIEGPWSDESEIIKTKSSPALKVLDEKLMISRGPPSVFCLPIKENITARNEKFNTQKFDLGTSAFSYGDIIEKTIVIVGATGSGKSTLINEFANYLMGVTWEDPFRFTLIDPETCAVDRLGDQACSQTEWVTCYTIHNSISDRIKYTLNLIDTPGFGDTRGLVQDSKIVEQIHWLFTAKNEKGVDTIDAVCFILKAPDARLTITQKYIFDSILALFGNDIKENICTLITFADGQKPPVLAAIRALEGMPLPCDTYFTFNNSALYVDNTTKTQNKLLSFFWDMGITSCQTFFSHLLKLHPKSLTLTNEVLRSRQKLANTISHLQQEIDRGISKINTLEIEVDLFKGNRKAIEDNKHFEYVVTEDVQEKVDLSGTGQYTTNCLNCNFTCHESCRIADDKDKAGCCAMNDKGNCSECPKNCHWTQHSNTPYIIKLVKKKVKKRYDEMKKRYEEAKKKTLTQEQVLEEMNNEIVDLEQKMQVMVEVISKLNNHLKKIALRPDPLSTVEYIKLMIMSEQREKKSGYESRIDALEKCKQRAQYGKNVQIFQDRVKSTRKAMSASEVADQVLKDENTSIANKIKGLFEFRE